MEIARDLGIEIPMSFFPKSLKEVKEIAKRVSYPCVIKLRRGSAAKGLKYANSPSELLKLYKNYLSGQGVIFDYSFPIIQEYIPGEVHDVCVLFNKGKPRALLTQRRIKMSPPTGGGGIFNETTDEPELKKLAIKLLKKIRWHGPAQVEFKIDSRDGKPKLMEVNPKFWGTLDLSIQAGIDFPYLACKMAVDGDVEPVFSYKVGLKYRWVFPYEFLYILKTKNKWKAIKEFFKFEPNTKYDIWLSDPLPHIAKIFELIWKYFER